MAAVDSFELEGILLGFQERMAKMALFDPLFELQRKKQTDADGQQIEMMELGLLTLLFFFEQKLIRNTRVGVKDLALYLLQVMNGRRKVDLPQCVELARDIIQVFRPASGKKREFTFINWQTGQQESTYTSILRANAFDSKANTQFYTLDEDGLELIFATKEFYAEFQLSIHQLVLRKQLEKGEFQGALRQINEMRVDVESLQERMVKLEHEIKRSIVSEETLKRYSGLLEDIYTRLQRENEEFEELRQFVKETMNRLYMDINQERHELAYELILRISGELEKVHADHSDLLRQSIELKNQALQSAKESLYYTGLNSFNFEQDVAGFILASPLPLESMKGVISPFLGLEQMSTWSLLTVFSEQNVNGTGEREGRDESFLEVADEGHSFSFVIRRAIFFKELMGLLLQKLEEQSEIDLREFIFWLQDIGREKWLSSRLFYDFWLISHQRSPVQAGGEQEAGKKTGLEDVFELLGNKILVVHEVLGVVDTGTQYQIQNMKLMWGDKQ